jgi:hypothetical protein
VQPNEHLGATVDLQFVKSSYSIQYCVEAATVPSGFVKSSSSIMDCVEANVTSEGCVLIRDSKDRAVPALHCDLHLWGRLIEHIKAGRYDYDRLGLEPPTTSCCPSHGTISIVLQLDRTVRVSHNQQPAHNGLFYTPDEWRAYVSGVKLGEFDLVHQDGQYHLCRKLELEAAAAT